MERALDTGRDLDLALRAVSFDRSSQDQAIDKINRYMRQTDRFIDEATRVAHSTTG
jgi:hypothetical protein